MKKILIIEDDPLIARVYGSKYAAAGFETSIATDGEMGLALLESFRPDLVHLDLLVPKVNGLEIVKHIRSRPELKSLPVVVLSNTYQNHLVKSVMAAGATELVSKATCTPKMMLEIVEKLRARMEAAPKPATAQAATAPPSPEAPQVHEDATPPPPVQDAAKQAAFQGEVRRDFLARAPSILAALREKVPLLLEAPDEATRSEHLSALFRGAHSFAGHAGLAGFQELSQLASALVALLTELVERPGEVTDSSLRTIVDACDFLPDLFERSTDEPPETSLPVQVLVVDDDAICRRAVRQAVARLNAATISIEDPLAALGLLRENSFDLILLDVEMPGMNGFELCRELRSLPANQKTPVIFVTTLAGLKSRESALASGGNDLIAKPFLPMELAVKALSLLRRRPR